MLASRGARWSREAVHTSRIQLSGSSQNARLYSIAARPSPRRPQYLSSKNDNSSNIGVRSFSSTPLQQWSWPSLWSGPATQPTSTSSSPDFATYTPSKYAEYGAVPQSSVRTIDSYAPIDEVAPAVIPTSGSPPTPDPSASIEHAAHHGTPLTGPEHFLPDPVTHPLETPIADIPEKIGYLRELGLDYGWGTSTIMQSAMEYIHLYTGMPWYATAIVTSIFIRVIFLRMQMKSSSATARWQQLRPVHEPLMEQLKTARTEGDTFKLAQLQKELAPIRKDADLKMTRMFVPLLGQGILGFSIWRNLRGMAEIPIPAFEKEQFLWLQDLSLRDPTFALAFAQAASMYFVMKTNASQGVAQNQSPQMQQIQLMLRRALPVVTFAIVAFQPAIVQIYFVTSSLLNLGVANLIKNKSFRDWAKMHQFPENQDNTPADPATQSVYAKAAQSAGIHLAKQNPTATSASSIIPGPPSSSNNVSWIDRSLDSVKSSFNTGSSATKQTLEKRTKESLAEKRAKAEKARADQYETSRRNEVEQERQRRNDQAKRVFEREREREREEEVEREMMSDVDDGVEVDGRGRREKRGKTPDVKKARKRS